MTEQKPALNTDRELFREDYGDPMDPGNRYAPSVHVTQDGQIGMNVGGMVIVMKIEEWHKLALDHSGPIEWKVDGAKLVGKKESEGS